MIDTFIILVLTHLVSDWFFQPHSWTIKKIKDAKYRLFHATQYTIPFILIFWLIKINYWWLLWIFITHFAIDSYAFARFWNVSVRGLKNPPLGYLVGYDQILHVLLLIPIVYF